MDRGDNPPPSFSASGLEPDYSNKRKKNNQFVKCNISIPRNRLLEEFVSKSIGIFKFSDTSICYNIWLPLEEGAQYHWFWQEIGPADNSLGWQDASQHWHCKGLCGLCTTSRTQSRNSRNQRTSQTCLKHYLTLPDDNSVVSLSLCAISSEGLFFFFLLLEKLENCVSSCHKGVQGKLVY